MRAKALASATGISKDTLRYYEKEGVISAPLRDDNGYRNYTETHVKQIKFVRYAQSVGFTLKKIKLAIPHLDDPKPDCPLLQAAIREQLEAIDQKIGELSQAKATLSKWIMPHE